MKYPDASLRQEQWETSSQNYHLLLHGQQMWMGHLHDVVQDLLLVLLVFPTPSIFLEFFVEFYCWTSYSGVLEFWFGEELSPFPPVVLQIVLQAAKKQK